MITNRLGPVGYQEKATEFDILPKPGAKISRIHSVVVVTGWAVNAIGINYDDASGSASYLVQPEGMAPAPVRNLFEVPKGDSLISIKVGWGAQAPGYPKNEIVTLQFETATGLKSAVYGGTSGSAQVTEYSLRAPDGHEIIGLFGGRGGGQNLIQRLGISVQARCDCSAVVQRIATIEERLAKQEQQLAELARLIPTSS